MENRMYRIRERLSRWALSLVLIAVALIFVIPLYWTFLSGFRRLADIFTYPVKLLPSDFTLDNFRQLLENTRFLRSYFNSVVVAAGYVVVALAVCSMGGYSLAKFRFFGLNVLFVLFLSTIMVPPVLFTIPQYILMNKLRWIDTYQALILPKVANVVVIFLMRQFILAVPNDLLEVSRIDGASEFRIFVSVVMPVIKSGYSVAALVLFGLSWNDFLWPKIVVSSNEMATLPLMMSLIREMRFEGKAEIIPYNILMAASVLIIIPLVIAFMKFSREFRESVIQAALKE